MTIITSSHQWGGASSPLLTDLIEWWKMDESGGGNRAGSHAGITLVNGGGVNSAAGHVHANASNFQGSSTTDFLSVAASSVATSEGTLAWWYNQTSANDWLFHVGSNISGDPGGMDIFVNSTNGRNLTARVQNDNAPASINTLGAGADGKWKCAILTWNATNANLYAGTEDDATMTHSDSSTGSYTTISGVGTFTVGERHTSGQNFDGQIGPVVLAGRRWDSDDRALFFNAGAGMDYPG